MARPSRRKEARPMSEVTPPAPPEQPAAEVSPEVIAVPLLSAAEVRPLPRFEHPLAVGAREARLLTQAPWVRPIGRLTMEVATQGWRFPAPGELLAPPKPRLAGPV